MATSSPDATAPDFVLDVANGPSVALSELWRERSLLLWFSRGLACPFCRRQAVQLRSIFPELERRHVTVVQVTPQPSHIAQQMLKFFGVPWLYACDASGALSAACGIEPGGVLARAKTSAIEQSRAWLLLARHPSEPHPEVLPAVKTTAPTPDRAGGILIVERGGHVLRRLLLGKLSLLPTPLALLQTLDEVLSAA